MRPDLLEAKATIDWAVAQLPVLVKRVAKWRRDKPYKIHIDTKSKPGKKLYRLDKIKPLDPIISAEAGAIIHSIRSSLDLLACALAARHGATKLTDTYFPVWKSEVDFLAVPGSKTNPTLEKIKRLSQINQGIIKALKPYPRGNDLLCTLHNLDLTRKHRRLLATRVFPGGIGFNPGLPHTEIEIGDWYSFNEKTVLLSTAASVPNTKLAITLFVTFDEAGIADRINFSAAISNFARLAYDILTLFCRPGTY